MFRKGQGGMQLAPEDLLRLGLAALAGGLIGMEREYRDKAAGLRTLIFICTGATLFTMLARHLTPLNDTTRIAAAVITGIGFLGAGTILHAGERVTGLTTAAAIWLTAGIGIGLGAGLYGLAAAAAGLAIVTLWLLPGVEHRLHRLHIERTYRLVCAASAGDGLRHHLPAAGLRLLEEKRFKRPGGLEISWLLSGKLTAHEQLVQQLLGDEQVQVFEF
jgi:putative Mg2+ transporter-C (MgtC) family protein